MKSACKKLLQPAHYELQCFMPKNNTNKPVFTPDAAQGMDPRLASIAPLIRSGHIKTFSDIFRVIPPSILARELGFNYNKMKGIINNPGKLSVEECYKIGEVLGVKGAVVVKLVNGQMKNSETN